MVAVDWVEFVKEATGEAGQLRLVVGQLVQAVRAWAAQAAPADAAAALADAQDLSDWLAGH